jgi:hypothetical protein
MVDPGEGHQRSFAGAGVRRFREAERFSILFRDRQAHPSQVQFSVDPFPPQSGRLDSASCGHGQGHLKASCHGRTIQKR